MSLSYSSDSSAFIRHQGKLKRMAFDMREFYAAGKKVRIYHGGTNSTRPFHHTQGRVIDISDFTDILDFDATERTLWVESNVAMKALVEATLPQGLIPPVVMELRSITVGGGIQGGAGESSSFLYGAFHETCLAFEVMLGNGELVMASPEENADLFYGLPGTYGTIGIITAVKLKLIPAKPFVRLRYERVKSSSELMALLEERIQDRPDFLDGLMFARDFGVLMSGNFSEAPSEQLLEQRTLRAIDEWFYLQAETIARSSETSETILPIRDYLFRYNRGAFWTGRYGFELLHIPFIRLFRFLLAPIFKTRILFRLLHLTGVSQRYLIQDCSVPLGKGLEFLHFLKKEVGIFPLWICPLLSPKMAQQATHGFLYEKYMLNVGVWGKADLPYRSFVALNRKLEAAVMRLKGVKVLYAHSYYTRKDFWSIYRRDVYEKLRAFAKAEKVFPDIYDKVVVRGPIKQSLLWGVFRGLLPPYRIPLKRK